MIEYRSIIRLQCKIPSVNCAYKPAQNGRRAWLYLDPEVSDFKTQVTELVQMTDISSFKKFKDQDVRLKLFLVFYISTSHFWSRDTSNMIKITEDAIVEATGIDDRFTTLVSACKVPSPSNKEAIGIRLRAYTNEDYNGEPIS